VVSNFQVSVFRYNRLELRAVSSKKFLDLKQSIQCRLKHKITECVEKPCADQKFQFLQSASVEILGCNDWKIVADASKKRSASIFRV
jgi:hypothetical protein